MIKCLRIKRENVNRLLPVVRDMLISQMPAGSKEKVLEIANYVCSMDGYLVNINEEVMPVICEFRHLFSFIDSVHGFSLSNQVVSQVSGGGLVLVNSIVGFLAIFDHELSRVGNLFQSMLDQYDMEIRELQNFDPESNQVTIGGQYYVTLNAFGGNDDIEFLDHVVSNWFEGSDSPILVGGDFSLLTNDFLLKEGTRGLFKEWAPAQGLRSILRFYEQFPDGAAEMLAKNEALGHLTAYVSRDLDPNEASGAALREINGDPNEDFMSIYSSATAFVHPLITFDGFYGDDIQVVYFHETHADKLARRLLGDRKLNAIA